MRFQVKGRALRPNRDWTSACHAGWRRVKQAASSRPARATAICGYSPLWQAEHVSRKSQAPDVEAHMALTLVIGNKNYSSWSMRPWIALKAAGIAFEEVVIPLYTGDADKQRILNYSPAGKVPILVDGAVTIWDSLAIIEYLAERFPEKGLWPTDTAARAHARSISAEMHSGFVPLRNECSMNIHRPVQRKALSADAQANVERIQEIWGTCRRTFGRGGPFLFGAFGGADAMYAPVVHRFRTYGIDVAGAAAEYMSAMQAHPAFTGWTADALKERWVIERFEND
jgi:glutathione S-transferase